MDEIVITHNDTGKEWIALISDGRICTCSNKKLVAKYLKNLKDEYSFGKIKK
jgi:hypothetical protein